MKRLFVFAITLMSFNFTSAKTDAVASKLTFAVGQQVVVLPNSLSAPEQTCISGGVMGPRVRLRAKVSWAGNGKLLPLTIQAKFKNKNLKSDYSAILSPGLADRESLAYFFDTVTDYIPANGETYTTSTCFLDYSDLPFPHHIPKGNEQLVVPVTVTMTGVIRDDNGNDTPFVKKAKTQITYVAGSVPAF